MLTTVWKYLTVKEYLECKGYAVEIGDSQYIVCFQGCVLTKSYSIDDVGRWVAGVFGKTLF
jgi:hypothetical protein